MRGASTVALRLQARSLVRRWARGLSDSVTYDAGNADVEALIEESIVSDTSSCRRCRRRRRRRRQPAAAGDPAALTPFVSRHAWQHI